MNRSNLSRIRSILSTTVCVLAIASSAADAQQSGQSSTETVEVTATRITQAGFNAPTPTTVVGSDLIESQNQPNLFNVVDEMPAMIGSNSGVTGEHGTSQANNGLDSPNLFGLGTQRTLTLLDGQRFVPAIGDGSPDVQQFPHLLVSRVDMVTGGASASWGSDAIAGVVNFVTDKKFVGFKAELEGGISNYLDNATAHAAFAVGSSFLGDRAHAEMSVEYDHTDGVPGGAFFGCGTTSCTQEGGRQWYFGNKQANFGTAASAPAGQPQLNDLYFLSVNTQAQYGLINSGPLQGTAFGVNGVPYQFNYGIGYNGLQGVPAHNGSASAAGTVTNCLSSYCLGGEDAQDVGGGDGIAQARTRGTFYGRLSYDLDKDTNIYVTTNFSDVATEAVSFPDMGYSSLAGVPANTVGQVQTLPGIQCGNGPSAANLPAGDLSGPNGYLPASINAACMANNITSFGFGSASQNLPQNWVRTDRFSWRVALGGDGAFSVFGSDWTWSGYYTHGQTRSADHIGPVLLYPYFYAAVDSVVAPVGNTLGVPAGTVVCRNATARAEGCVPFDPFGNVQPTQQQLDWIYGGKWRPGPFTIENYRQDAASFSINGAPFSLWAGKVAVAAGLEYRQEGVTVLSDGAGAGGAIGTNGFPASTCVDALLDCQGGNNWYAGNFHNGQGTMHVNEGFMELGIPLLDSTSFGRADLDVAARYEMYAPQGDFLTWKAGLNWDTPIDGLRVRTLMSRDVHAPTLFDLFEPQNVALSNLTDPFTGQSISSHQVSAGNAQLKPERATNSQLGFVYQPNWLAGFHMSIDYYRYEIASAISTVGFQTVANNCAAGLQQYCAGIVVNGAGTPATNPSWKYVYNEILNVSAIITDGFNYEADYSFDLQDLGVPGDWNVRAVATNVSKFITYPNVAGQFITDTAGQLGGDTGVPHWNTTFFQTYKLGDTSITLTERLIGSGNYNALYHACTPGSCPVGTLQNPTVNDNHIPGEVYFNLGVSHNVSDTIQAFIQINNLLNKDPPPDYYPSYIPRVTDETYYDPIGRMFNVGIRIRN